MRRWLSGWAPLLRLARRDALRARGRSALIVAMIALPVLALTAVDVLARSAQLDPDERVARVLGATQARLDLAAAGTPVLQAPDPGEGIVDADPPADGDDPSPGGQGRRVDPRDLAPAGFRVLTSQEATVSVRTRAGLATVQWNEVAVGDDAFAGRFRLRAGSAPDAAGEVAVTSDLLARLGVELGGRVELTDPARTVTVTGVVDQVGFPAAEMFWAAPGELIGRELEAWGPPAVYLAGDGAVTWSDVVALNRQGVVVFSRAVVLDPPDRAAVPHYVEGYGESSGVFFVVLLLAVVVVLAGLEVTLLAGAAFAVGARRQARSLGLVAAAGGSSGQVRRVVLAGGIVLGAVGALLGVAAGLLLAAGARPVLARLSETEFGRFDVRPLELLAVAVLGLATGLLAAVLPARTAARQDPVVALTGRRGQVRTARKVPVIGVALTAIGVGAAAAGSALALSVTSGLDPADGRSTALAAGLIGGGAALAQVGLIVTSPALIGLAARWSRWLPPAGRLALRDAARHRGRSAPAMAAVLTAVAASTALLLYVASLDAHDREQYTPSWPARTGGVQLVEFEVDPATGTETRTQVDPSRVLAALSPVLPPFEADVVTSAVDCGASACYAVAVPAQENECFLWELEREPTAEERRRADEDWRCSERVNVTGSVLGTPVGGNDVLELVAGGEAPAAAAKTLEQGGIVVFDRRLLRDDGTVVYDVVSEAEAVAAQEEGRPPWTRQVSLPATYVEVAQALAPAVYSEAAARELGLQSGPSTILLRFHELPTADEEEAAQAALRDAGMQTWFSVERGYVSDYGLGLLALVLGAGVITLGAAGIATGLAQADARADHATLAAVGAAPRLRRTLAAAQALTISGLGTALGVAAGFVPALALIAALQSLDLVVPWWQLAQVMAVVPALAGGSAWLLTRSRIPLERGIA